MGRKKQRETYGNGSITPVKAKGEVRPDTWRICITLGKDAEGKRRKVQKVVHCSLADARKMCRQMLDEYANVDFGSSRKSFSGICESWVAAMRGSNVASESVINQYERHLGYMAEQLDGKPIIEIKKLDIEQALAATKSSHTLSNTTMHKVFAVTKRVFEYAVETDAVLRNPCRAVTPPKVDKVASRKSLTAEECAKLRVALDRDEAAAYSGFEAKEQRQTDLGNLFGRSQIRGISEISGIIAIRLMLATGMRRGEAFGLTWGNVDFECSQIFIRQSLTERMEIKEPKTASGMRSLFVDGETMLHLKRWRDFQAAALLRIASCGASRKQTDATPVCCSDLGAWYDPTNAERWWRAYRERAGFPSLKMHELRHTQATMLLGNGVDVKTVQTRLGHASSSLTLDQYAHAIPANDRVAAETMGAIYGQKAVPNGRVVALNKTA